MYADKDSAGTGEAKDKSEADRAIDIVEAKLLEVFKEDGYLSENASTACSLMFLQCPSRSLEFRLQEHWICLDPRLVD